VDVNMLDDWSRAVRRELGLPAGEGADPSVPIILDTARDVAHGVARPAAPLTAYLLGLAVGRSGEEGAVTPELAARISALAEGWQPRTAADDVPAPVGNDA
jgi:Domain of unknown function (DUF6457)